MNIWVAVGWVVTHHLACRVPLSSDSEPCRTAPRAVSSPSRSTWAVRRARPGAPGLRAGAQTRVACPSPTTRFVRVDGAGMSSRKRQPRDCHAQVRRLGLSEASGAGMYIPVNGLSSFHPLTRVGPRHQARADSLRARCSNPHSTTPNPPAVQSTRVGRG